MVPLKRKSTAAALTIIAAAREIAAKADKAHKADHSQAYTSGLK